MTQSGTVLTDGVKTSRLNDPVLQELWAIKANLNARANYSVDEIVRRLQAQRPRLQALREQVAAVPH